MHDDLVLNVFMQVRRLEFGHDALVKLVQLRSLGHSANELTWLELSDLHIFVDQLVLTLVAETSKQTIHLDIGLNQLVLHLEVLNPPQLVEY